jgi:hypothetical protein
VELPKIKASRGRKESLRSISARFDGVFARLVLRKRYFPNVGNKFNSAFDNKQFFAFRKKSEPPLTEEANNPSSKNAQLLSRSGSIFVPHDVEVDVPFEAFSSLSDHSQKYAIALVPSSSADNNVQIEAANSSRE